MYGLFDRTCRGVFGEKQAKPIRLTMTASESQHKINGHSNEDIISYLRPKVCPAFKFTLPIQSPSAMLPTKSFDRFSPPPTSIPSQSPRLCYFISRSNGTFVPLIPADELPYSVRLAGVPRAMNIEHSCGMSHVGTHAFTGQLFQLEPVDAAQHIIDRINTCHVNGAGFKQRPASSGPILHLNEQGRPATRSPPRSDQSAPQQLPVSATATTWRRVDDAASAKSQEIIDNIIAQGSHSSAHKPETALRISRTPSSSPKSSFEQKDKIYCSYWIRSGECDYTQQGCRYKHEMPDKATLASIGFRTVPRWWQEKVAIQLGQSAIPTVGPVMKPAEWLKQRRESQDSQDSQSDEDSQSEHESEIGGENISGVDAAPTSTVQESVAVLDDAEEKDEQAAALESEKIGESPDKKILTEASATATTETTHEPCRKLSDVDLIDLSPISPTRTSTCKLNGTDGPGPIKSAEPYPAKTPTPSLPVVVSKQPITSPRKVFVPAGESTEFHVADARKHAQTQNLDLGTQNLTTETKQCKSKDCETEKIPPRTPITLPKPSEAKSGLMASMHAPKSVSAGRSRPIDGSSSAKKAQRQPRANGSPCSPKPQDPENGCAKRKAAISSGCSRPSSQKAGTPSSTAGKAAAVDDKCASPKYTRSTDRVSPKSVCRPRRPAASNSKVVVSGAVAGGTKE